MTVGFGLAIVAKPAPIAAIELKEGEDQSISVAGFSNYSYSLHTMAKSPHPAVAAPPNGLVWESPDVIVSNIAEIERTALTKNEAGLYYMPLGNVTQMTEAEQKPFGSGLRGAAHGKDQMTHYPRDMVGYGQHHRTKGGNDAKIAVQFVINYEERGENCIHTAMGKRNLFVEIVGAQPWLGQRHLSMESIYEYGSRAGSWRLLRTFEGAKLRLPFRVGMAWNGTPAPVIAMMQARKSRHVDIAGLTIAMYPKLLSAHIFSQQCKRMRHS